MQKKPLRKFSTHLWFSSVQSLSRVWLWEPMNYSTPGLPVHHQLPDFTQTQIRICNSCCSVTQSCLTFVTPRNAACQASVTFTISRSLLRLMSLESVMPSNHLVLYHPLLLLPSIFPRIRVFANESALRIRWLNYWSFSFSVHLSNEYSGLISFRIDWLDLLAVQGTLKNLLQHHSSKASGFGTQLSLWLNSHIHTWLLDKP